MSTSTSKALPAASAKRPVDSSDPVNAAESTEPNPLPPSSASTTSNSKPTNDETATRADAEKSCLTARTLFVQYDNLTELLNRIEGNSFHTVIIHIQNVPRADFKKLAMNIAEQRPQWNINEYHPRAELMIVEIPSAVNNALVSGLRNLFFDKFKLFPNDPQFELIELSGQPIVSLDVDSITQPGMAVRPKMRLDGRHVFNPEDPEFDVELEEQVEVIIDVEEPNQVTENDILGAAELYSMEDVSAEDQPTVTDTTVVAIKPTTQEPSPLLPLLPLLLPPSPSPPPPPPPIDGTEPSDSKQAVQESTARHAKGDKRKQEKVTITKMLSDEERTRRRLLRQERAQKRVTFPSLVVECSYAQSALMLRNKLCWWYRVSDQDVRVGVLAKTIQSPVEEGYGNIVIEKWKPCDGKLECEQKITIYPGPDGCPMKKKKAGELAGPHEDERMKDSNEKNTFSPEAFEVDGGPLVIEFNDLFAADEDAPPRPEFNVVITDEELQQYAYMVWKTAILEDAGMDTALALSDSTLPSSQ